MFWFLLETQLSPKIDVDFQTHKTVKMEQFKMEFPEYPESWYGLHSEEIMDYTNNGIKLENFKYEVEVPESCVKIEIDEVQLENDDEGIDHNM